MPKVGMEPIRRAALIKATITEIGKAGSLDITVSQIAKQAGMSSALAHHYFGSKDEIFLAAMRHVPYPVAASAGMCAERLHAWPTRQSERGQRRLSCGHPFRAGF